jgi:hypothetical protein
MKQQRIVMFSGSYNTISKNIDLHKLNSQGWEVKQIVSTSFLNKIATTGNPFPVIVITALIEKVTD